MNDENNRVFAEWLAKNNFEGKPGAEVMALGYLMQNWLKTEMSDNGSGVDTGAGFDRFDLWVTFGGQDMFITIRRTGGKDVS